MTAIVVFGYKRELTACLDAIKTDLPVEIFMDKANLGLKSAILRGMNWMFEKYDSVIVIEDDVIISPDFIEYMLEGLDFYKDKKDIGSITGWTPIETEGVYASGRPASWGWGTWKDRWDKFDPDFRGSLKGFDAWGEDMPVMLKKALSGKLDTWDIQWGYFHHINGLKCIHPPHSKVKNIGLNDGTHFKGKNIKGTEAKTGKVNFYYPVEFDEEIRLRFRHKQSFIRKIINLRYR